MVTAVTAKTGDAAVRRRSIRRSVRKIERSTVLSEHEKKLAKWRAENPDRYVVTKEDKSKYEGVGALKGKLIAPGIMSNAITTIRQTPIASTRQSLSVDKSRGQDIRTRQVVKPYEDRSMVSRFTGQQSVSPYYEEQVYVPQSQAEKYQSRIDEMSERGSEKVKPLSDFSIKAFEGASWISDTVRTGEPILTEKLEEVPGLHGFSQVIGYPVRSTASFIEMGGMLPGGAETMIKTPSIIGPAFGMGIYQSTVGMGVAAREDPLQFTSDIATGALLFGGIGKVGTSVSSVIKTKAPAIKFGKVQDVMIKKADVYVAKEIKTPIDFKHSTTSPKFKQPGTLYDPFSLKIESKMPVTTSPRIKVDAKHVKVPKWKKTGRDIEPYGERLTFKGEWGEPKVEPTKFYSSKLRQETEYGGIRDIYTKFGSKAEQAQALKALSAENIVAMKTMSVGGKSHLIIEPKGKIGSVTDIPFGGKKLTQTQNIMIGEVPSSVGLLGKVKQFKVKDYIRFEKKLDISEIDLTVRSGKDAPKQLTSFAESKIYTAQQRRSSLVDPPFRTPYYKSLPKEQFKLTAEQKRITGSFDIAPQVKQPRVDIALSKKQMRDINLKSSEQVLRESYEFSNIGKQPSKSLIVDKPADAATIEIINMLNVADKPITQISPIGGSKPSGMQLQYEPKLAPKQVRVAERQTVLDSLLDFDVKPSKSSTKIDLSIIDDVPGMGGKSFKQQAKVKSSDKMFRQEDVLYGRQKGISKAIPKDKNYTTIIPIHRTKSGSLKESKIENVFKNEVVPGIVPKPSQFKKYATYPQEHTLLQVQPQVAPLPMDSFASQVVTETSSGKKPPITKPPVTFIEPPGIIDTPSGKTRKQPTVRRKKVNKWEELGKDYLLGGLEQFVPKPKPKSKSRKTKQVPQDMLGFDERTFKGDLW